MDPGIEELQQMLSDNSLQATSSSSQINVEGILDRIDCLLQNLQDFPDIEDLEGNLKFLKNFIIFVMLQGLEHFQVGDLLNHAEVVLVDVASFVSKTGFFDRLEPFYSNAKYEIRSKIEPFKFPVYQIYVRVLQEISKLSSSSTQSTQRSHSLEFADFVDSLISLLLSRLNRGTSLIDVFRSQMHKLYEGLRFLRITLGEQNDKVDEKCEKRDGLIGPVICEAGIIIFYLFLYRKDESRKVRKLEPLFSHLEGNLKLIKVSEEESPGYLLKTAFPPQTNLPGVIDFVLEKLKSFILNENAVDSDVVSEKDKFQIVHDDLAFLRSILADDIGKQQLDQALCNRIAAVTYEIEFILDSLVVGGDLESLLVLLNAHVIAEIELVKAEVSGISHSRGEAIKVQNITKAQSKMAIVVDRIPNFNEPMVGLDDEVQKITDRLTRGTSQLDLVSIVGMAGLGKTTLAKKVYLHFSISHYFYVRSWCTVSQVYNKKSVLLEILRGLVDKSVGDKLLNMTEDELAHKLYQELKGKRYLIVLDDVWDTEVWSSLRISFPDDIKGSRIVLTSRHENLAWQIKRHSEPHCLRALNDVESWDLFRMKVLLEEGCPSELVARAKAIVQHCKGLPLMILIVAGILLSMELRTLEEVEEMLERGGSAAIATDQCKETLELSYRHLPGHLKQCFLYFGAYKEDEKIPVGKLLQLWIAEGLVEKNERECLLEDLANGYMTELIQRNLVMISEKGSRGNVKFCVLHDLLHEFSVAKGNEERFLHRLHGQKFDISTDQPRLMYRICVHPKGVSEFAGSRQLCPRLRTFLFSADFSGLPKSKPRYFIPFEFCQYKLLRVLDLRLICEFNCFPSVVLLLIHLKYLAFSIEKVSLNIPPSIANLSNLETFIVNGGSTISLPDTLWNMKALRHLDGAFWELPTENLEGVSSLENLLTLNTLVFPRSKTYMEVVSDGQMLMEILEKLPNLRRLKCILYRDRGSAMDVVLVGGRLESLSISSTDCFDFHFPQILRKLNLENVRLRWSGIAGIQRLPNLEVLKLRDIGFEGPHWDMENEEAEEEVGGTFPKLRVLRLRSLSKLVRWTCSDDNDHFPSLETLVLQECFYLKELPSCLAQSSTLQMIEVNYCPNAADSIKEIQEMQMDLGNEDLKILIR
ncbi:OLC1v1012065C1 [Oldenlandia corymbosa var. corymbosa]|uniref:OLC1v1012065C1 n=1 Tax=Oldenlandia corymbosa var. corymbosa TaxID=529605 RepID=A0AAV1DV82_OLDCO|nr:OLC1v1012065C1 [Oldenlandia corymbosa var. corymbosa]